MARPRKDLASQVQDIVADAMERVRVLVQESLSAQLGSILGATVGRARSSARRATVTTSRRRSSKRGRPGRKPTVGPERVEALVALVSRHGEVLPRDARKVLKLSGPQMQAAARAAAADRRIKIAGRGRGTRYVKN